MKNIILLSIVIAIFGSGCASNRDLVYFSNLDNVPTQTKIEDSDVKIQQNDLLSISVNSMSPESNVFFASNGKAAGADGDYRNDGYKVSKDGSINFPVIGKVSLEGKSLEEAQSIISTELNRLVKKPVVEVKLVNFKVTVIGEVNRPSSFTVSGDRMNLLEALGMAGDMTVYGKRENVLVIRQENGQRIMKRLNLNEEEVLNSPFFYLRQNDIVYVEPDKSKAVEFSSSTRMMPIVIASISALAVLASVILNK